MDTPTEEVWRRMLSQNDESVIRADLELLFKTYNDSSAADAGLINIPSDLKAYLARAAEHFGWDEATVRLIRATSEFEDFRWAAGLS